MSGTYKVRALFRAELDAINARRDAIYAALAELDKACDHADCTISPYGHWVGGNGYSYNGSARCNECGELCGDAINDEIVRWKTA